MSLLRSMGAGIRSARPPYISINNRQFHAVNGNDRRPIMGFDQRTGRTFCDFVVIGAAEVMTKILYQEDYTPGSEPKPPLCSSFNGVGPSIRHSPFPQAPRCDQCEWNIWAQGAPPVCKDYKTLVVLAPLFSWEIELQLNIPPASFKNWSALLASLGQVRMDGGRPLEGHEIIIRMYFGGEQGILEFIPAENAFVAQACGQQTLDYIATKLGNDKVRMIAGHDDQPIDPARWIPPTGQAPAALPAPVAPYQPPAAPQTTYAPPAAYTPAPAPLAPPAPPAAPYAPPPASSQQNHAIAGVAQGGVPQYQAPVAPPPHSGQPEVTYHSPAPLEGGYMNQGTPQQNYAATGGHSGAANGFAGQQPARQPAPEPQYQPQGAVAAAGPELVENRPNRKPRATKAEMAARRASEQQAPAQQGGYAQVPGEHPAQQQYAAPAGPAAPQQNGPGGYAQAPGAPAAPQKPAGPSTDMQNYGMTPNPEQAGAALMTQLQAAINTPTR